MATVLKDLPIPKFGFRRMLEDDVPAVAETERAGYAYPWSEGIFRDCLRAGYICRVADVDGLLVGYGIVSVGAGEAHIKMLMHLTDLARASGAADLFLEVRPSNVGAVRLYQSAGFQQVGIRRGYYQADNGREDAVVMRLALNP
jgi:ribosomal-protein-alanine N-acetyltransferase